MDRGWIILQSFIKRVYPKPETKFIVESKRVKDGEVLEVIEKYGMWYKVKYQGEVGYVRTTDSLIFDQKVPSSIELSRNKALFTHSFLNLYQKNQELVFPPNQLKNLKEAIS
ncbi:SH3 domain-containing protein [Bacillus sp. DX1.1]|uniref:SH3 domain-containing protein n=1 Tax=unclassified Bacillus (in: firmicutes) TaxID=185979 RepID=UPI00257120D1|nr:MULTISPECIES: SH3 domain-containing protein [unclassified Bacillus (in: firmicutes)]MDM5155570.1 SH3 domain-containing protein [Bacillus sp. DX1.1]WJE79878.1 SH3 domain-containing protein [Bacillus sp. DX3.1]